MREILISVINKGDLKARVSKTYPLRSLHWTHIIYDDESLTAECHLGLGRNVNTFGVWMNHRSTAARF